MANIIEVPGFGRVEFPAGMSDDDIATAIRNNMPQPAAPPQPLDEMSAQFGAQPTPPAPSQMPYREQIGRIVQPVDDAVRMLASGATLGGADRFAAWAGGGKLEDERARTEQARTRLGPVAAPLEIGGGVASAIAASPVMASTYLPAGAGAILRGVVGAGEGAALGAADAYMNRDQGRDLGTSTGIGAAFGFGAPLALGAARRVISPFAGKALTPEQQRLLSVAKQEGIDLPAGAQTQSRVLKWMDAVTDDLPGGQAARERTQQQFQGAVARRIGEAGDQLDPATLDQARRRIGGDMDRLLLQTQPRLDPPFAAETTRVLREYADKPGSSQGNQLLKIVNDTFGKGRHPTAGEYVTARRRLEAASNSADVDFSNAAKALKQAFDDMAERSMPAGLADQWRQSRQQYYNLMRVREAATMSGEAGLAGGISGSALNAAVKNKDRMGYSVGAGGGADRLEDLGRVGGSFLRTMPNSGSAQRAAIGAGVLGAAGGVGNYIQSGDVGSAGATGLGTALGAVGAGVAYRQPWAQRYLSNRVMSGPASANVNLIGRAMQMGLLGGPEDRP